MSTPVFSLRVLLHVEPPESAELAVKDIRDLCLLNDEIQQLNPKVSNTNVPGQLQVEFIFAEEDPNLVESRVSESIEHLLDVVNTRFQRDEIREGSNWLTFA